MITQHSCLKHDGCPQQAACVGRHLGADHIGIMAFSALFKNPVLVCRSPSPPDGPSPKRRKLSIQKVLSLNTVLRCVDAKDCNSSQVNHSFSLSTHLLQQVLFWLVIAPSADHEVLASTSIPLH